MKPLVLGRDFSFAGLIIACICAAIWSFYPQYTWWLCLLAISPWIIRGGYRRPQFPGNPLNIPVIIFLFTSCVGLWAAYNQTAAWAKFWTIIGGIILFFALTQQPRENMVPTTVILSGLCAFVAIYFVQNHNWNEFPADLTILNNLGTLIMKYRPKYSATPIHPNIAAGMIAVFTPLSISLGRTAWNKKQIPLLVWSTITGGLGILGLGLSSSRAAWFALAISSIVIVIGKYSRKFTIKKSDTAQGLLFSIISLLVLAYLCLIFAKPYLVFLIDNFIAGIDSAGSRLEIFNNTLRLIAATPFTGGGLSSFPGLYSQYILDLPFYYFGYSHNLYLDIAQEQGFIGLFSFLVVITTSIYLLVTGRHKTRWHWAILCGLMVFLIHGLMDDPLYGNTSTPLFFVLPGMSIAISQREKKQKKYEGRRLRLSVIIGLIFMSVFIIFFSSGFVKAAWNSNIAAIEMAKIELVNFPTGQWDEGQNVHKLMDVEKRFARALSYDHRNLTAHYRLGRIAMQKRNFPQARLFLENAHNLDPGHRGVIKTLGYCYVWIGMFEEAKPLMDKIPEATNELQVYSSWWHAQGRQDLTTNAVLMLEYLDNASHE